MSQSFAKDPKDLRGQTKTVYEYMRDNVHKDGHTYDGIVTDTHLPRPTVRRICATLLKNDLVRINKKGNWEVIFHD